MFKKIPRLGVVPLLSPILAAFLLVGCFATGGQKGEPVVYDLFGNSQIADAVSGGSRSGLMLRLAEIQAPAWLNTPAMQYRLLYAEPERRSAFAESRWVAPPAELIEQFLKRNGIFRKTRYEADGCQLHLALDEFIQTFDAPGSSQALLEVRASLLAPRNVRLVAQRTFRQAPAAGGDAKSGVGGFSIALRDLTRELNDWLLGLQRDMPDLAERCR